MKVENSFLKFAIPPQCNFPTISLLSSLPLQHINLQRYWDPFLDKVPHSKQATVRFCYYDTLYRNKVPISTAITTVKVSTFAFISFSVSLKSNAKESLTEG